MSEKVTAKRIETNWEPQEHKNVYAALLSAQLEFGQVTKGSVNPAFKSKYADLSDVASVVIPTLARHGVAVTHYLSGDSLNVMVTAFIHAESDTRVECPVPLIVNKQDMQGFKSATTYAKRIGLESLSGVAPEDDDGNAAAAAAPPKMISAAQQKQILDLAEETGSDLELLFSWIGKQLRKPIQSAADIPVGFMPNVVAALNRKKEQASGTAE